MNLPFLVLNIKRYNIILRRKYFAYLDIVLNIRERKLKWPKDLLLTPSYTKEIKVPLEDIAPLLNLEYEADIRRREIVFEKEDKRRLNSR